MNNQQKLFSTMETKIGAGAQILASINTNVSPPTMEELRQKMLKELEDDARMGPRPIKIYQLASVIKKEEAILSARRNKKTVMRIGDLSNPSYRVNFNELKKSIAWHKMDLNYDYTQKINAIRKKLKSKAQEKRRLGQSNINLCENTSTQETTPNKKKRRRQNKESRRNNKLIRKSQQTFPPSN